MDWKKVLKGVAPGLATALGGPATIAGAALSTLSTVLLGKPDGTAEEIGARLQAPLTGAEEIELRKAEQAFTLGLAKIAQETDALEVQDRANARQREVSLHDLWTPRVLGFIVIAVFGFIVIHVLTSATHVEPQAMGIIGTVIGYASAKADTVVGYYFGGSFGSRQKDATIAAQLPKK